MSKSNGNVNGIEFNVVNLPEGLNRRTRTSKYQPVVEKLKSMKIGDGKSVSMNVPKNKDANTFRANIVQNVGRYVRVGTRMSTDDKGNATVFLFPSAGRQGKKPATAKKN